MRAIRRVTDAQVKELRKLLNLGASLKQAAMKSGMDRKSARKYRDLGCLPSESRQERSWRTRRDPLASVWPELVGMLEKDQELKPVTLMEVFQQTWEANQNQQIQFGATETAESLGFLARRMLERFLGSELAQPEGEIIGIEEEPRGELVPGVPDLLGRIDLLLETEEHVIIQDFKTARSVWSPEQAHDQAEQLLLYGDLVRRLKPGKELKLRFAVITKTKDPKVQVLDTPFDTARLDRTKQVFQNVWLAIQFGHFYPVPSPMSCTGCGFRSQCTAWRG